MKLSYWGFLKEKEFNEWLESFDINYSYSLGHSSCTINKINNEREYESLVSEWDLVIKWNVSYKEYHDELGGCITTISMSTWENGFSNRSKYIKLELSSLSKIKKLKITSNNDDFDISKESIKNHLDDYMVRINPELSKKFIRDKKIKEILNN